MYCRAFIPVSLGAKSIKIRPRNAGVIIKNKVARFMAHSVFFNVIVIDFSR